MMVRLAYDVTEVVMNYSVPLRHLYSYLRRLWRTTRRRMAKYVLHYFRSVMPGQFEAASCDSQQMSNSFFLAAVDFVTEKGKKIEIF
jgi:hypothetical protein